METKTISTPCGNVIGEVTPYGLRFRGIKYAAAGRFEMPVEVRSFGGDFDATKQGVCCPQMRAFWNEEHRFYYQEFRKGKEFTYSEDCLVLDVHAPDNAKNCPVIVFIHGGSFTGGSINEMQFNGSAYTKRDVIFIAINYRLNVFGFFCRWCALQRQSRIIRPIHRDRVDQTQRQLFRRRSRQHNSYGAKRGRNEHTNADLLGLSQRQSQGRNHAVWWRKTRRDIAFIKAKHEILEKTRKSNGSEFV